MNRDTGMQSTSPSATSMGSANRFNYLPEDFVPGEFDVVCGRGKKCYSHVGNEHFRHRVLSMLGEYSKARSKLDKSSVLSDVVEQVRQASPGGGFVKQDDKGRWFEVGDFLAREKTSQAFRDALHDSYKSSNVSKKKRRQEEQARMADKFQKYVRGDVDFTSRMNQMMVQQMDPYPGRSSVEIRDRLNRLTDMPPTNPSFGSRGGTNYRFASMTSPQQFSSQGAFTPISRSSPLSSVAEGRPTHAYEHGEAPMRSRPRAYSLPSSPHTVPTQPTGDTELDLEDLHHSLPNMHWQSAKGGPNDMSAMHHSMPIIDYNDRMANTSISSDFDPFPVVELGSHRDAMDVPSSFSASKAAPSPVSRSKGDPQRRSDAVSKDLVSCLEKLTEHTISDDNPFEPIPIGLKSDKMSLDKASMHSVTDPVTRAVLQAPMVMTPPTPQAMSIEMNQEALRNQKPPPFRD